MPHNCAEYVSMRRIWSNRLTIALALALSAAVAYAEVEIRERRGLTELSVTNERNYDVILALANHFDFVPVVNDPVWGAERRSFRASGHPDALLTSFLKGASYVLGYAEDRHSRRAALSTVHVLGSGRPDRISAAPEAERRPTGSDAPAAVEGAASRASAITQLLGTQAQPTRNVQIREAQGAIADTNTQRSGTDRASQDALARVTAETHQNVQQLARALRQAEKRIARTL